VLSQIEEYFYILVNGSCIIDQIIAGVAIVVIVPMIEGEWQYVLMNLEKFIHDAFPRLDMIPTWRLRDIFIKTYMIFIPKSSFT